MLKPDEITRDMCEKFLTLPIFKIHILSIQLKDVVNLIKD